MHLVILSGGGKQRGARLLLDHNFGRVAQSLQVPKGIGHVGIVGMDEGDNTRNFSIPEIGQGSLAMGPVALKATAAFF